MKVRKQARLRNAAGAATGWVAVALLLVLGSTAGLVSPESAPPPLSGFPFYPDLIALAPDDLYFSTEILEDGLPHRLLRFSTSVSNVGEGPLELAGNTEPGSEGNVVQVVYDAAMGGAIVEERLLGVDLIHHASHRHFHLDGFASYELWREEPGSDTITTGHGGKQSSCVLDNTRLTTNEPRERTYEQCELERQGISVGWADTYAASLPEQWVDLGSSQLADGAYMLRYTVDPLRQIDEGGRIDNNMAETRFTVSGGAIMGRPEPPRCSLDGDGSGIAGEIVRLRCSHFKENSWVNVYWDAWDPWDPGSDSVATFTGQASETTTVDFQAPHATAGAYTITAVAFDRETGRFVSATVIFGVVAREMRKARGTGQM